ncbi:hypothetical protein [Chelativorans intermedius]|uniref:Uncharacterized protein n=1 Tax=Chelativorans intermedius TaxID=515947 RepID=A0ABV6D3X6_9HYPH|nr:hypothetical protein [Chelativorans intermedius]MCT8997057.1 hypothetical protein [Chelativorans intermedius]
MLPYFTLHRLAAPRGEGLRPELLDLLARPPAAVEGWVGAPDINTEAPEERRGGNVLPFPGGGQRNTTARRKDRTCLLP